MPIHLTPKELFSLAVIACMILPLSLSAGETVHRCSDARGQIIFQQNPCADGSGEAVEINIDSPAWQSVTPGERRMLEQRQAEDQKQSKRSRSGKSGDRSQARTCLRKKEQVEQVNWQLRKGYKPALGERLRQRRRELEDYLRRYCR